MTKTIKEIKDFTKRMDGGSEVIINMSGTEIEIESMAKISAEGADDILVLYASVPFGEDCED